MAVKIRLKRMGKIRAPYYRIVVADSRTKRDGRVIEEIGKYHPKEDPSFIEVDSDRALYWLGVGAQPSEPVAAILKVTGDWQKFAGEPPPPPMLVAEARRDKSDLFNEALKDSKHEPTAEAVTPRRPAAKKTATAAQEPATDVAATEEPTAEEPTAEEPTAEEPTAEEPTADEPTADEPTDAAPADEPAATAEDATAAGPDRSAS
ncbi:MAG: 30S ribosomal protein S16 [Nocardioidaceae bacterium]